MNAERFFIGWQRQVAPGLRRFLLLAVLAVPLGGGAMALLLGATADDPAGPRFALLPGATMPLPLGETALTGVLTLAPYPVLHLPPDAAAPRGRAVLLADDGKRGATIDPALEGRTVVAQGFALARGDVDMLVLGNPLEPAETALPGIARAPGSAIAPARCSAWTVNCRRCSSPPLRLQAMPSCSWAPLTARACRLACAAISGCASPSKARSSGAAACWFSSRIRRPSDEPCCAADIGDGGAVLVRTQLGNRFTADPENLRRLPGGDEPA